MLMTHLSLSPRGVAGRGLKTYDLGHEMGQDILTSVRILQSYSDFLPALVGIIDFLTIVASHITTL